MYNKEYAKNYREKNKSKIVKQRKDYRESNKEKISERNKKYRENNKEKISEINKKYRENNKERVAERVKNWAENNRERVREIEKRNRFKREYGITLEERDTMYDNQNGCCSICNTPQETLCIDHNHITGTVRGMLCTPCNLALGWVRDDINTLENMIEYLKMHA